MLNRRSPPMPGVLRAERQSLIRSPTPEAERTAPGDPSRKVRPANLPLLRIRARDWDGYGHWMVAERKRIFRGGSANLHTLAKTDWRKLLAHRHSYEKHIGP